jgi:transposase
MTDKIRMKDIAKHFNVTSMTIYRWKKEYKDIFSKHETVIKKGKRSFFFYSKQILSEIENEFDKER